MAHATETSVKWFWSGMQGAPSGTGYDILKKCLSTGFNSLTFDSLVIAGGIATATRASGHGFLVDSIIAVSGVTSPAALNADHRILSITTTTITFPASLPDQTATGTIVIKQAPAGWSVPFDNGSNKIVIRSPLTVSPQSFYRFDGSSGSNTGRPCQAYGGMSNIDTGTEQWDDGTQRFYEWSLGSGWMLFADKRTVYWVLAAANHGSGADSPFFAWGDFISFLDGDAFNELFNCHLDISTSSTYSYSCTNSILQSDNGIRQARLRKNALGTAPCQFYALHTLNSYSGYGGPSFPSPVNNAIVFQDCLFRESGNGDPLRGRARGLLWCLQDQPLNWQFPPQTVEGVAGMEGRKIMVCLWRASVYNSASYPGRVGIDITGPWEA